MASPGKTAAPWAVKLVHDGKEQGVPAEKIRQKLVLEGLEPDLIDGVVEAGSLSGKPHTIEPSSPCTSPQRRQLSARCEDVAPGYSVSAEKPESKPYGTPKLRWMLKKSCAYATTTEDLVGG